MNLSQHPDAIRWNNRYQDRSQPGDAVPVLQQNIALLPANGKALEIACGLGANTLLLAQHGLEVDAWDISQVAVDKLQAIANKHGLNVHTQARDVVNQPPEVEQYDVIVVSFFLERSLMPALINALKPGGIIYYQTFARENATSGPSNPAFRLDKNELLTCFNSLTIRVYRDDGQSAESFIVAQKPEE
ncbi:MAG: methyltransferase domain-containing protein [Gammaproteobacteria bacterium]|nr:methyltransferase domain-containing protein [Gammaproteobacteria bacterium]